MWDHWIYKQEAAPDLEQGDVLTKSAEFSRLLDQYHPHYAARPDNRFFSVLTQSCDLVHRGGACNARYVTIAPVRSLAYVVSREFRSKLHSLPNGEAFADKRVRGDVERFLARLFNNNEPRYFFLEKEASAGITEPMCVFLELPISLKVEHWKVLLESRTVSINDEFQAKMGWLLGQLYSRVGTRDYPPADLQAKIEDVVTSLASFVESESMAPLKAAIEEATAVNPEAIQSYADIVEIVRKLPKKKDLVIDAIIKIAAALQLVEDPRGPNRFKFRKELQNSSDLAGFF